MSTAASSAAKPSIHTNAPSNQKDNNPSNGVSDGNETDDEWWEEEDTPPTNTNIQSPTRSEQWPKPPTNVGLGIKPSNRRSVQLSNTRYSVQRPYRDKSTKRQKMQNLKAGIKVVTDLRRAQAGPRQLQPSKTMPQMGCFVDLAALQALNGEPVENSLWKSKKPKDIKRAPNTVPIITHDEYTSYSESTRSEPNQYNQTNFGGLTVSPIKAHEDLSPSDRPIVIGLSIPSIDAEDLVMSPQTAASETSRIVTNYQQRVPSSQTPETPSIIITPAQGVSLWSIMDNNSAPDSRPRAASSVYSQAVQSNDHECGWRNAPPLPQMPTSYLEDEKQRIAGLKSCFSPDSDDATNWDDEASNATRSRIVSSCTVFEEDDTPILARGGRARSMSGASVSIRHPSMSTIRTRRLSLGWWNYITTPFMTRSNTFATREVDNPAVPALPNLAVAAAKADDVARDEKNWEKQFSPLTPATSTTISSEQWWNDDSKVSKATQSPVLRDIRHKVQASTGTLPIVFSEAGGLESASMSSLRSGNSPQLSRGDTTSTFKTTSAFSVNDREVPVLFDAPNTRAQRANVSYVQPTPSDLNIQSASRQVIQPLRATVVQAIVPVNPSPGEAPPPPYSPSPTRLKKYRVILPPGHAPGVEYPGSPGPVSPGLQAAMTAGGAIPMSNVPLTPPARRPINLNSGYPTLPVRQVHTHFTAEYLQPPSKKAKKAEAKRQRYEKEEAVARKAGGWWRGRGCISNNGCYGRGGAEGRKRRRWYLVLIISFLSIIILAVVLATQLHRKSNTIEEPSQWLNLTGFPPIFAGLSTVAAPINIKTNTGCVFPSTQWSCDLPKELQDEVAPNLSNQPNFLMRIQWDNSSSANETFANVTGNSKLVTRSIGGNAVSARQLIRHLLLKARQAVLLIPNPDPPTFAENAFLGNSTDGIVSNNKAGEPTPFYISFLPPSEAKVSKREIQERQSPKNTSNFPDLDSVIPAPSINSDGTALPANLLAFPVQQPVRLYDRGLPTEHYGFYTYYDRSIFLKSITRLNETNLKEGVVPDDLKGGARESEANFRCTWTQTRFLVQMWTKTTSAVRLLNSSKIKTQNSASAPGNFTTAPQDFKQPGSFSYPISITIDRHGGDPATKMLYCYAMNDRRGLVVKSAVLREENRGFAGTLVNGAPTFFRNTSDATLGGFDGGNGGCGCKWRNFEDVLRA